MMNRKVSVFFFVSSILAAVLLYTPGCGTPAPPANNNAGGYPAKPTYPAPTTTPTTPTAPAPTGGCTKTTFDKVQPILASFCLSCHGGINTYAVAQAQNKEISRRINLPLSAPGHMPLGGQLTAVELQTMNKWITDGAIDACH